MTTNFWIRIKHKTCRTFSSKRLKDRDSQAKFQSEGVTKRDADYF